MEATLEPRLVMKGEEGKPFVSGEFFVAAYQRGYRWGRDEVRQLLDDIKANARSCREAQRSTPSDYYLQPIVVLERERRDLGAGRRSAAPHDPVPDHEVHQHEALRTPRSSTG